MSLFYFIGTALLTLFEFLNVYFIMPLPGSQDLDAAVPAYFLYQWRWWIRGGSLLMIALGARTAWTGGRRWAVIALTLTAGLSAYIFNFRMNADHMFLQPNQVRFATREEHTDDSVMVLAANHNGQSKAWPMRYLVYHHQVKDTLGGKPVLVTYCSVCRTARIFEPLVNGEAETFRLVGMNRFNAMFEDSRTGSWWRQANGEAILGPLTGTLLPEVEAMQMTAGKFFSSFPDGLIMLPDEGFMDRYDTLGRYEKGKSKSSLTRTDSASWQDKSWVVGLIHRGQARAYDWNELSRKRMLADTLGGERIALLLTMEGQSFQGLLVPPAVQRMDWRRDTLHLDSMRFDLTGKSLNRRGKDLKRVPTYQEFWHSWRTFHPETTRY